ncbi:MAG: hypothetical protein NUV98_02015 [Candidatus Roizmanbacteria bacterium]|nr:hypothetical protein [Candidatus Roizmanbacteria bacterium]
MLEDLIISRVRMKILALFFLNPEKKYHLREIQRQTNEAMNAIRREMQHLQDGGFASAEVRGNRKYYLMRHDNPFYFDLIELINKSQGLGKSLLAKKAKLGKVRFIMLSGKYVRGIKHSPNDVDLLLVGHVVLPEVLQVLKQEEQRRGAEINYTVMTEDEFKFRKQRKDPFVERILKGSRVMILGDEEELVK